MSKKVVVGPYVAVPMTEGVVESGIESQSLHHDKARSLFCRKLSIVGICVCIITLLVFASCDPESTDDQVSMLRAQHIGDEGSGLRLDNDEHHGHHHHHDGSDDHHHFHHDHHHGPPPGPDGPHHDGKHGHFHPPPHGPPDGLPHGPPHGPPDWPQVGPHHHFHPGDGPHGQPDSAQGPHHPPCGKENKGHPKGKWWNRLWSSSSSSVDSPSTESSSSDSNISSESSSSSFSSLSFPSASSSSSSSSNSLGKSIDDSTESTLDPLKLKMDEIEESDYHGMDLEEELEVLEGMGDLPVQEERVAGGGD